MITKDGFIVRVAPIVDTSAIRQAVLDDLTCDYKTIEIGAGSIGRLLGIIFFYILAIYGKS